VLLGFIPSGQFNGGSNEGRRGIFDPVTTFFIGFGGNLDELGKNVSALLSN